MEDELIEFSTITKELEKPYFVSYPEEFNGKFEMTKKGMEEAAEHNLLNLEKDRKEFQRLLTKTSYGVKNKLGKIKYFRVDNIVHGTEFILRYESRYIRNTYEQSFKDFSKGLTYYEKLVEFMEGPDKIAALLKIMKLLGIPL